MLPNGVDFPIVWFALAKLGAVIVPVNINYHDHDLTYTLDDSQAGFFVVHENYLEQWERVRAHLPSVKETLLVTESGSTGPIGGVWWMSHLTRSSHPMSQARIWSTSNIHRARRVFRRVVCCSKNIGWALGRWRRIILADARRMQPDRAAFLLYGSAVEHGGVFDRRRAVGDSAEILAVAFLGRSDSTQRDRVVFDRHDAVLFIEDARRPALERGHKLRMICVRGFIRSSMRSLSVVGACRGAKHLA
jgi:hypothetical protein